MPRPVGSKNKRPSLLDVRKSVEATFNAIGGNAHMKEWALANPDGFYAMMSKLIPKQVEATVDATVKVTGIERVIVKAK